MTISNLIARLEAASGPDRELEAEIALQAGWQVFPGDNWIGPEGQIAVPEYTASIDPAVALAVQEHGKDKAVEILQAALSSLGGARDVFYLPRALLIATIKAKEASDVHPR